MKRKIIQIDEKKCTGCGLCIPDCPEGALQILDGKARLVSDLFCDGLGACIGTCPEGAIAVIEREAEPYDEKTVMATITEQGPSVIRAHLEHLLGHKEIGLYNQAIDYLNEYHIRINLTEQGFDVSTVQAAVDSGDKDAAKKALDEFFQAHPEAKPKMPAMPADRLKEIVQNLSSKGDVSTIQAALDSGDTEKAQKLLDEFWQQHPDAKPAPPEGGQPPQQ